MITTAVLDQFKERISSGDSLDESSSALGAQHRLSHDECSALWLFGHPHAADQDTIDREQRARAILKPID